MIDWPRKAKELGFNTELQMWKTLMVSLRNSEAIAKYLGVSRGAVQRRRHILNIHSPRRGGFYRKAEKRAILEKLPDEVMMMPIEDIIHYVWDKYQLKVSPAYVSKFRTKAGF
jgi:Zn-dependent peptidase ImmA (M78 family)